MTAKTVLAAAFFCTLLAGCNPNSETDANEPNEAIMRKSFVDSCAASAHQASNGSVSKAQAAELCGCGYDKVSAEYSDRTAWRKALISHGLGRETKESKEIFDKLVTALQNCIAEHDAAAAPQ